MIKFKQFNKEGIKKAGSIVLVTTILTTGICTFSGCGKQNKVIEKQYVEGNEIITSYEKIKRYGVVIENEIVLIFDADSIDLCEDSVYIKFDNGHAIRVARENIHVLNDYTLEEVEEYARMFLTENGKIEYYNGEGKGKTLTRTKDNS